MSEYNEVNMKKKAANAYIKKKARKHKPDWPLMFADRIIDLENRMDAVERQLGGLNATPNAPPTTG